MEGKISEEIYKQKNSNSWNELDGIIGNSIKYIFKLIEDNKNKNIKHNVYLLGLLFLFTNI